MAATTRDVANYVERLEGDRPFKAPVLRDVFRTADGYTFKIQFEESYDIVVQNGSSPSAPAADPQLARC